MVIDRQRNVKEGRLLFPFLLHSFFFGELSGSSMDDFSPSRRDGDSIAKRKDGRKVSTAHKRSKSASDKNLGSARHVVSPAAKDHSAISKDLRNLMMFNGAQSPVYLDSSDIISTSPMINHRTSLENDYLQIEQLQMRLHEERSVRNMLERAMGRASSTLSPGHRHFAAQTMELIQEIELLEEEVANREQHVLSMYRSIFDQCLSGTPSVQSSVMTSPAHTKNVETKKHPSIISSTFCSSRKFPLPPLPPFQGRPSQKDSRRKSVLLQSKTRRTTLSGGGNSNVLSITNSVGRTKVLGEAGTVRKTSLVRTLKDHLYQCPSKLSEELVRCMAAIYCWVCASRASSESEKSCSSKSKSKCNNVVLPQQATRDDQGRRCGSMLEISWISTDKNQYSRASFAISSYRVLVEQLEKVNLSQMENDAKLAFWINVYNSLVMHAYLAYGIPNSALKRMALFHKAAYNIGGYIVSANSIEYAILCWRTPRIGRWYETIISTAMRRKSGEEKQLVRSGFGLSSCQPLICFALCSGATSDPVLRVYTATNVKEEMEVAKKDFLQTDVIVKKSKKVLLPRILERYSKETCISSDDLVSWVSHNVEKKLHYAVQKCINESKPNKKLSQIIEWLPYDTRFRYVFAKDLTEKPWWV